MKFDWNQGEIYGLPSLACFCYNSTPKDYRMINPLKGTNNALKCWTFLLKVALCKGHTLVQVQTFFFCISTTCLIYLLFALHTFIIISQCMMAHTKGAMVSWKEYFGFAFSNCLALKVVLGLKFYFEAWPIMVLISDTKSLATLYNETSWVPPLQVLWMQSSNHIRIMIYKRKLGVQHLMNSFLEKPLMTFGIIW